MIGGNRDINFFGNLFFVKKEFCVMLSNYIHKYYFTEDSVNDNIF